jgi:hypothetical protein
VILVFGTLPTILISDPKISGNGHPPGVVCDCVGKMPGLTRWGFRKRQEEGSVVLDLSLGPDALFRNFSANRRNADDG